MYSIIASAISIIVFAFAFPLFGINTELGSEEIVLSTILITSSRAVVGANPLIIFTLLWVEFVGRTSRVNLVEGFINQLFSSKGIQVFGGVKWEK
jgi:hypothetical protein